MASLRLSISDHLRLAVSNDYVTMDRAVQGSCAQRAIIEGVDEMTEGARRWMGEEFCVSQFTAKDLFQVLALSARMILQK
jgi:hypothetical protein